ncbi:hypothetical protein [Rhizobium mesoamericanum]|uniref:DUF2946 domain-containing protein n=1 Tax=Rhizobium mesoamericanum STM3625 TaxID=1211777 RepID=K0Q479_9HYPH|nr:hypothetical protein [Rhizobium mesoamericanum]CCM79302.1 conserved exported hypothetical protein [Rhizobium mesoamericanum STM3625]
MSVVGSRLTEWLVRVICAIALLFAGSSYQAPGITSSAAAAAEFAQYILPDGTLPVICTDGSKGAAGHHDKSHARGCEACRISPSILLPLPDASKIAVLRISTRTAPPTMVEGRREGPHPPNKGPRAPPTPMF